MHLNTLKRYARKSSKWIMDSANREDRDLAKIGNRLSGNVKAMKRIYALEPYDRGSPSYCVMRKWGKL
jgi:hypothetical protein